MREALDPSGHRWEPHRRQSEILTDLAGLQDRLAALNAAERPAAAHTDFTLLAIRARLAELREELSQVRFPDAETVPTE